MSLLSDFQTRYPELSSSAITWVPILENEYQCYYGADYSTAANSDKAIILALLAHLIWFNSMDTGGESIKPLNSASVGSVSTSFGFAATQTNDLYDFFSLSKYGQLFLMLTRTNQGAVWVQLNLKLY